MMLKALINLIGLFNRSDFGVVIIRFFATALLIFICCNSEVCMYNSLLDQAINRYAIHNKQEPT